MAIRSSGAPSTPVRLIFPQLFATHSSEPAAIMLLWSQTAAVLACGTVARVTALLLSDKKEIKKEACWYCVAFGHDD